MREKQFGNSQPPRILSVVSTVSLCTCTIAPLPAGSPSFLLFLLLFVLAHPGVYVRNVVTCRSTGGCWLWHRHRSEWIVPFSVPQGRHVACCSEQEFGGSQQCAFVVYWIFHDVWGYVLTLFTSLFPFTKFHHLKGLGSWEQLNTLWRGVSVIRLVGITHRSFRSSTESCIHHARQSRWSLSTCCSRDRCARWHFRTIDGALEAARHLFCAIWTCGW